MRLAIFQPAVAATLTAACALDSSCHSDLFHPPIINGVKFIGVTANAAHNYSRVSLAPGSDEAASYTIDFCNVTITYTHPGWKDTINVNVWLPLDRWNKRLWALGGGGYSSSFGPLYLTQAVGKGFAAIATDSGHTASLETSESLDWALSSPGNLNWELLEDWGYRALGELATIGKSIVRDFYSRSPAYSYFSGCSGGGRQAMMIAQRYPADFDGILAVAPAINAQKFIPAAYWATQVMKNLGVYPSPCELEGFTSEAVEACDSLDGLTDGIISMPSLCNFTAHSVVGKEISCNGTRSKLSAAGAKVAQAAWDGPTKPNGRVVSPGLGVDASLTSTYVTTTCSSNGTCSASDSHLISSWIETLVVKDPSFDISKITNEDFFRYLRLSQRDFAYKLGAYNEDLSEFRKAGGKLLSWHGSADEAIPTQISRTYYNKVLRANPRAHEFYRFFEAPGVGHCYGGTGPLPNRAFDQLIDWVEKGTTPTVLRAGSGKSVRPLCPYPLVQTFTGSQKDGRDSFRCLRKP